MIKSPSLASAPRLRTKQSELSLYAVEETIRRRRPFHADCQVYIEKLGSSSRRPSKVNRQGERLS